MSYIKWGSKKKREVQENSMLTFELVIARASYSMQTREPLQLYAFFCHKWKELANRLQFDDFKILNQSRLYIKSEHRSNSVKSMFSCGSGIDVESSP